MHFAQFLNSNTVFTSSIVLSRYAQRDAENAKFYFQINVAYNKTAVCESLTE